MADSKLTSILKTIGPGIMFAGAAIGGSHLVQSTRAGANFGLELMWMVLLINLLKYPFFEYGHRYVAATGQNMIRGYSKMGNWVVWVFFVFNFVLAIVNVAGVTMVCSALTAYFLEVFFSLTVDIVTVTAVILSINLLLLIFGKYAAVDKIVKGMIIILSISTVLAFGFASTKGIDVSPDFVRPELWNTAGIGFLIALMGWMPAPIEGAVWTSIWTGERSKETGYKPNLKELLIDFHIGYVGTAVLAVFFVGLGAFVMYGTGEQFSNSGVVFSKQLVSLYQKTLGDWSLPIISTVAMITMFSTTITVLDAYPRSLDESVRILFKRESDSRLGYILWAIFSAIAGFIVISMFISGLKTLVDLATMISFLAAPIFALLNYKLVTGRNMPESFKPAMWMRILSWVGIIYFFGFAFYYLYTLVNN